MQGGEIMGLAWIYHSVPRMGFRFNLLTLIGRLVIQAVENKTRQNKQGKPQHMRPLRSEGDTAEFGL